METKRKTTFGAWLATFVLCYFFWILLTGSFAWQELVAGAVVSAGVALFSARWFVHEHPYWFFGKHLFILIWYCVAIFPWELLKANWDMAKRSLSPKLNINPGISQSPGGRPHRVRQDHAGQLHHPHARHHHDGHRRAAGPDLVLHPLDRRAGDRP